MEALPTKAKHNCIFLIIDVEQLLYNADHCTSIGALEYHSIFNLQK